MSEPKPETMPMIDKLFLIDYFDNVQNQLDIDAETIISHLSNNEEDEMIERKINEIRDDLVPRIKAALDTNLSAFKECGLQAFSAGGMLVYVDQVTCYKMWPRYTLRWRAQDMREESEQPLGVLVSFDSNVGLKFIENLKIYLDHNNRSKHTNLNRVNLL